MFGTGIDVAVGLLLALVFCQYLDIVKKAEKAFTWIVTGAVSFLLAGVFDSVALISTWVTSGGVNYGFALFSVVGWILVLVGSLWAMYQLLVE